MQGERCVHEWMGETSMSHHETLLMGIEECLERGKLRRQELGFLSVGVGPGMFTGLRIGITTAKFLADPLGIPCVPVSSLMALASQAEGKAPSIWALGDARSKRLYALNIKNFAPDYAPPPEEAVAIAPEEIKFQAGDYLLGEGAALYAQHWPASVTVDPSFLKASSVGKIGAIRYRLALTCSAVELEPKYLKTGTNL